MGVLDGKLRLAWNRGLSAFFTDLKGYVMEAWPAATESARSKAFMYVREHELRAEQIFRLIPAAGDLDALIQRHQQNLSLLSSPHARSRTMHILRLEAQKVLYEIWSQVPGVAILQKFEELWARAGRRGANSWNPIGLALSGLAQGMALRADQREAAGFVLYAMSVFALHDAAARCGSLTQRFRLQPGEDTEELLDTEKVLANENLFVDGHLTFGKPRRGPLPGAPSKTLARSLRVWRLTAKGSPPEKILEREGLAGTPSNRRKLRMWRAEAEKHVRYIAEAQQVIAELIALPKDHAIRKMSRRTAARKDPRRRTMQVARACTTRRK